jgi:hypothetical protein
MEIIRVKPSVIIYSVSLDLRSTEADEDDDHDNQEEASVGAVSLWPPAIEGGQNSRG